MLNICLALKSTLPVYSAANDLSGRREWDVCDLAEFFLQAVGQLGKEYAATY